MATTLDAKRSAQKQNSNLREMLVSDMEKNKVPE